MKIRIDIDSLLDEIAPSIVSRGERYHHDGRVTILDAVPHRVLARVEGTEPYITRLFIDRDGHVDGDCSCPAYENYGPCKHMVAVGLTILKTGLQPDPEIARTRARIRTHLKSLDVDTLVGIVLDCALTDPELYRRLDLTALPGDESDDDAFTRLARAIDAALPDVEDDGWLDADMAEGWTLSIDPILTALLTMIETGRAELARRLIDHIRAAACRLIIGMDGDNTPVIELFSRLDQLHLAACRAAPPPPVTLAERLFARDIIAPEEIGSRTIADYTDLLGPEGLASWRRLVVDAWAAEPVIAPRPDSGTFPEVSARRLALARIMDQIAEADGDVEARIAIRARTLTSPADYRKLVEFCLEADRPDAARHWLDEGIWLFEGRKQLVRDLIILKTRLETPAKAPSPPADAEIRARTDRIEALIATGGRPAYEQACQLLKQLAALRSPAAHATHLDEIRRRYRSRRVLMSLLDA
ncbi:SWIM zinc finger family protein [Tistrella mobilis]|uniref:SWIM zinc finger family protein n=1 Tax=Tistrella mobilis TaxID=171437 RepID=UPI0035564B72